MGDSVKKNTSFAVEIEDTEGTYKAPTSAASFLQVLADGAEINPSKSVIERNVFTGSIGQTSPRTGQFEVAGSLPVECRAHSTAGSAPEYDKLIRSAMGSRRQITTTTTTKSSGNTDDTLEIEDADISKFAVGDIVLVKESNDYHISPITAVDSSSGAANITLLVPRAAGAFSDSVVIEKSTIYTLADSGHPSLSISKYVESLILEQAVGCKVTNMAVENFTTNSLPTIKFDFGGLNFDRSETAPSYSPSYDTAFPPIILGAKVFQDGVEILVNDINFTLENTLGYKTATSARNGRIASRATNRVITGSMNPYKASDNIDNFTTFKQNTLFSLFAYAMIPSTTSGQFSQIVAFYMPNCLITELGEADSDGLLQETISFSANRGAAGTTPELYFATI